MAALSGAGSFSQAVTTWDKSELDGTEICASPCVSLFEFFEESGVLHRFKSCRGHQIGMDLVLGQLGRRNLFDTSGNAR